MEVMGCAQDMNRDEMVQFVLDCRHPSGGFSGNVSHDPHLLYTLSAVQVPPLVPFTRACHRTHLSYPNRARFWSFSTPLTSLTKRRLLTLSRPCSSLMALSLAMNGEKSTRDSRTAHSIASLFLTGPLPNIANKKLASHALQPAPHRRKRMRALHPFLPKFRRWVRLCSWS